MKSGSTSIYNSVESAEYVFPQVKMAWNCNTLMTADVEVTVLVDIGTCRRFSATEPGGAACTRHCSTQGRLAESS